MNELSRNEAIYLINRAQIIFTWTMEWIQMDSNFQVEINRGNRRAQTRLISTIFPFPSFSHLPFPPFSPPNFRQCYPNRLAPRILADSIHSVHVQPFVIQQNLCSRNTRPSFQVHYVKKSHVDIPSLCVYWKILKISFLPAT